MAEDKEEDEAKISPDVSWENEHEKAREYIEFIFELLLIVYLRVAYLHLLAS